MTAPAWDRWYTTGQAVDHDHRPLILSCALALLAAIVLGFTLGLLVATNGPRRCEARHGVWVSTSAGAECITSSTVTDLLTGGRR